MQAYSLLLSRIADYSRAGGQGGYQSSQGQGHGQGGGDCTFLSSLIIDDPCRLIQSYGLA